MFYVLCNVYDASCGVYCKMRVRDILNPVFSVDEVAHFWPGSITMVTYTKNLTWENMFRALNHLSTTLPFR